MNLEIFLYTLYLIFSFSLWSHLQLYKNKKYAHTYLCHLEIYIPRKEVQNERVEIHIKILT